MFVLQFIVTSHLFSFNTVTTPTKDNRHLPAEVAAIVDSTPELQADLQKNRPDALPGLRG